MSLDPKTIWKQAAARAATSTPNIASGAAMLAASAALWNPLPLVLWGLGSAAWVLFASTSPKFTRRVLDEDRRRTELAADAEREALRAKIESILAWQPYLTWVRSGLLPDYLQVFRRLVTVRDRVAFLLSERKEDYLAGLGIQSQLTYLLTAYLQFVQARLALLQTLLDFRPGGEAAASGASAAAGGNGSNTVDGLHAGERAGGAPAHPSLAAAWRATTQPSPMTPITERAHRAAGAPHEAAGAAFPPPPVSPVRSVTATTLPDVASLTAQLELRITALRDLAAREPSTARTREWHVGLLQKQQELLRDCSGRDQQLVAQLTAVPDAFDVIAGRISAAQFDAQELAAYTGGIVEQIGETEKFVESMRPVTDELLAATPAVPQAPFKQEGAQPPVSQGAAQQQAAPGAGPPAPGRVRTPPEAG